MKQFKKLVAVLLAVVLCTGCSSAAGSPSKTAAGGAYNMSAEEGTESAEGNKSDASSTQADGGNEAKGNNTKKEAVSEKPTTQPNQGQAAESGEAMYKITRSDVISLMVDFFTLQSECIIRYTNATRSKRGVKNPGSAIDLIDQYQGTYTADSRYIILEDYDSNELNGLEETQNAVNHGISRLKNADMIYSEVQLQLEDSNLSETGFKYYSGTERAIGVKLHYYYYYSDSPFNAHADSVPCEEVENLYAVLVNCGEDKWAIKYLIVDTGNQMGQESAFTKTLTDEDDLQAGTQAVEGISEPELQEALAAYLDVYEDSAFLFDFNNSSIPYFLASPNLYHYENGKAVQVASNMGWNFFYKNDSDYIIRYWLDRTGTIVSIVVFQYQNGKLIEMTDNYVEDEVNSLLGTVDFTKEYNHSDVSFNFEEAVEKYNINRKNSSNASQQSVQVSGQEVSETVATKSGDSVQSSGDYILPDSSSRYLSESEVRALSKDELRLARNEVYARHGRKFDAEDLQAYFNSKPWYNGTIEPKNFNESVLNEYEIANLDLIRAVEGN